MNLIIAVLFSISVQAEFKVPPTPAPVTDQAGMLSATTVSRLESLIRRVRESGGAELAVLTVPTLDGTPIEEATLKVAESWGLGGSKNDDGILLLIAQKERALRIEVGQGREGNVPDVIAKRIISDVIVPRFRAGNVDEGVWSGVLYIYRYSDPEILEKLGEKAPSRKRANTDFGSEDIRALIIMFILFGIFAIPAFLGRRNRRGFWGGPGGFGGGGGPFIGGGGWGGGSGGGGWGGGGGGFSGGGASGGW